MPFLENEGTELQYCTNACKCELMVFFLGEKEYIIVVDLANRLAIDYTVDKIANYKDMIKLKK